MERVRPTTNLDGRQLRRDRKGVRSSAIVISAAKNHIHWCLEL